MVVLPTSLFIDHRCCAPFVERYAGERHYPCWTGRVLRPGHVDTRVWRVTDLKNTEHRLPTLAYPPTSVRHGVTYKTPLTPIGTACASYRTSSLIFSDHRVQLSDTIPNGTHPHTHTHIGTPSHIRPHRLSEPVRIPSRLPGLDRSTVSCTRNLPIGGTRAGAPSEDYMERTPENWEEEMATSCDGCACVWQVISRRGGGKVATLCARSECALQFP